MSLLEGEQLLAQVQVAVHPVGLDQRADSFRAEALAHRRRRSAIRARASTGLFQPDQDDRAPVETVDVVGPEAVDAVRAGQLVRRADRLAQRRAELRRTGLAAALQRARRGIGEDQVGIVGVGRERIARQRAFTLPVGGLELERDLLHRVRRGELVGHHDRTARHDQAVGGCAGHAHEVGVDEAMRAVQAALVAALGQAEVGQRARRPGVAGEHRVGARGDDLEHLARHRRIAACIALVGDDPDAGRRRRLLERAVDEVAQGVAEADVGDGLDALGLHVIDDRRHHQRKRLADADRPAALAGRQVDRRRRQQRRVRLARHRGDRHGAGHAGGADQRVDLVVGDELARVARGDRRVGRVVEHDQLHLVPGHQRMLRQRRLDTLGVGNAEAGDRARHRADEADLQVGGERRRRQGDRGGGRGGGTKQTVHGSSSASWPERSAPPLGASSII